MLWNVALIYVANDALKEPSDPEWRFYFMLCLYVYRDMTPYFPVAKGIAQGLLTIAMDKGMVNSAEVSGYMASFEKQERLEGRKKHDGGFILDLDLAIVGKEAAQVDNLTERFDKMTAVSDWIDSDG